VQRDSIERWFEGIFVPIRFRSDRTAKRAEIAYGADRPFKGDLEIALKQEANSKPVQLALFGICIGFTER
jgi:hypothetical protein